MERYQVTVLPCRKWDTIQEMWSDDQEVKLARAAMGWFVQQVFSEAGQRWFHNLPNADQWNTFRWNDYRAGRLWWEGYKVLAANLTTRKLLPKWVFKTPKSEGSAAGSGSVPTLNLE